MVHPLIRNRAQRRDEAGALAVIVAFSAVMIFVLAAMVVDLGLARDTRRQSQNAADASALAAANAIYPKGACSSGGSRPCMNDAVNAAKLYAERNFGTVDWTKCPAAPSGFIVPIGSPTCISFKPTLSAPEKVSVVMPTRNVDTALGGMAGVSGTIPVSAYARSALVRGVMDSCSLCFLGDVDAGNGTATVDDLGGTEVNNGQVMVNGTLHSGKPEAWDADGGISVANPNLPTNIPNVNDIEPFEDPWINRTDLPPSLPAGFADHTAEVPSPNPCVNGPGVYGAYTFGSSCPLSPGLYVLTAEWTVKNTAKLSGTGVTIYAKAPNGYFNGKVGEVDLKAGSTSVSGSIPNVVVVYDRTNLNMLSIQGNGGGAGFTGGVYVPNGLIDFNGTSDFTFNGGPIIAKGVEKMNGDTKLRLNATTSANAISETGDVALDQ